jgi:hypothetical protein
MCQRATGGLFAALAGSSPDNFAWTQGSPAFFASSNPREARFLREVRHTAFVQVRNADRAHVRHHRLARSSREGAHHQAVRHREPPAVGGVLRSVPAERTGESAAAQEFLAKMQDHQSRD